METFHGESFTLLQHKGESLSCFGGGGGAVVVGAAVERCPDVLAADSALVLSVVARIRSRSVAFSSLRPAQTPPPLLDTSFVCLWLEDVASVLLDPPFSPRKRPLVVVAPRKSRSRTTTSPLTCEGDAPFRGGVGLLPDFGLPVIGEDNRPLSLFSLFLDLLVPLPLAFPGGTRNSENFVFIHMSVILSDFPSAKEEREYTVVCSRSRPDTK